MSVTLQNTRHQAFHGTYYCDIVGRRTSDRLYDVRRVRSPNAKIVSEKQPHSFMVPALRTAEVHEAALHLPQVKAARNNGWLRVVAAGDKAPAAAPKDMGASSEEQASGEEATSGGKSRRSRRGE